MTDKMPHEEPQNTNARQAYSKQLYLLDKYKEATTKQGSSIKIRQMMAEKGMSSQQFGGQEYQSNEQSDGGRSPFGLDFLKNFTEKKSTRGTRSEIV